MAFSASHELVVTICQSRSNSARVCKRTGSSPTIKIDAVTGGFLLNVLLRRTPWKTGITNNGRRSRLECLQMAKSGVFQPTDSFYTFSTLCVGLLMVLAATLRIGEASRAAAASAGAGLGS